MTSVIRVVVYPPTETGGRRVRVDGTILGTAYSLNDVVALLQTARQDWDDLEVSRSELVEWRGGGPDRVWIVRSPAACMLSAVFLPQPGRWRGRSPNCSSVCWSTNIAGHPAMTSAGACTHFAEWRLKRELRAWRLSRTHYAKLRRRSGAARNTRGSLHDPRVFGASCSLTRVHGAELPAKSVPEEGAERGG